MPTEVIRSINSLAILQEKTGNASLACITCGDALSLARECGSAHDIAACLNTFARLKRYMGDVRGSIDMLHEALSIYQAIDDTDSSAAVLNNIGCISADIGDLATARAAFEEGLLLIRSISNPAWTAFACHNLGDTKARQGDPAGGLELIREAIQIRARIMDHSGIISSLEAAAFAICDCGNVQCAIRLVSATSHYRSKLGIPARPVQKQILEHLIDSMKMQVSASDFHAAWSVGRSLTEAQTVSLSLYEALDFSSDVANPLRT